MIDKVKTSAYWLSNQISPHDTLPFALPTVLFNLFSLALTPHYLNLLLVFNIDTLVFNFLNLFLIRGLVALQCCVAFCHTWTWISHRYTYVPSLMNLHPTPPGGHRASGWAPCAIQQLPIGSLFYTWSYIYANATLSIYPTLYFPLYVHKPVLYVWVSFVALQIGSPVPFF